MEFEMPNGKVITEETKVEVLADFDWANFVDSFSALSIYDKRKAIEEFEFVLMMNEKWYKSELKFFAQGVPLTLFSWFTYNYCVLYGNELLVNTTFAVASIISLMFLHSVILTITTTLKYRKAKLCMRLMKIMISES